MHECTVRVLATLCSALRNVLHVQLFCIAAAADRFPSMFLPEHVEFTRGACMSLSSIAVGAAQKCLAASVGYINEVRVVRGSLEDALHLNYLLRLFATVCKPVATDGSAQSTSAAIAQHFGAILDGQYKLSIADSIRRVIRDDSFLPFPVNSDDFPLLHSWVRTADADAESLLSSYLEACNGSLDGGAVNPFFTSIVDKDTVQSCGEIGRKLFEGFPLFCFSSFMTCKKMIEVSNAVAKDDSSAHCLMTIITQIACTYAWFVATHHVASTDSVAADADLLIPTRIREFAAKIRGVAESVPLSDDYPLLAGAMCHSWKQRAGLAGHLFAAQERVTAICSLDTVVQCHRLVIIALTPLLLPETQEALMNFSEVLVGFSRYAQVHSIRKLSGSIVAPESAADRCR